MDANQRLDYFRSELVAMVEKLRSRIDELEKKVKDGDIAVRSTLDALTKDVDHLRIALR